MINLVLKQHMTNIVLRLDFHVEYLIQVLHFTWNYNVKEKSRWLKRKKNNSEFKYRSSHSEVFLRKGVLKICIKFTGEHQYPGVISIKLQINVIEITLQHGRSPANMLHVFRIFFYKEHLWRAASVSHIKINKSIQKQRCISLQIWCLKLQGKFFSKHYTLKPWDLYVGNFITFKNKL